MIFMPGINLGSDSNPFKFGHNFNSKIDNIYRAISDSKVNFSFKKFMEEFYLKDSGKEF
jgi:hypothetical protein